MKSTAPSKIRFFVLGWLFSMALLGYLCRNGVSQAEKTIRAQFELNELESGIFMASFFWSYALLQVPMGILAKRVGTRRLLSTSAVAWGVGCILIGTAPSYEMLIAAQLLMGLGQACMFPCAVQTLAIWVSPERRASFTSLLPVGMQTGAIIAAGLTGELLERKDFAWEMIFIVYGIPSLMWALLFALHFRNSPEEHPEVNQEELEVIHSGQKEPAGVETGSSHWGEALKKRSTWYLCTQQMTRAGGYIFFATWFPTFLKETRDVATKEAGYLTGLVFAASLLGSLCGGQILDAIYKRTGSLRASRQGVSVVSLLCCSLLILGAWQAETLRMAITLICAGVFASAVVGPASYTATIDLGGEHVPQVFGLMNMAGNIAAALSPILVGAYFKKYGDWNMILSMFAVIYFLGALSWLGVNFESGEPQS